MIHQFIQDDIDTRPEVDSYTEDEFDNIAKKIKVLDSKKWNENIEFRTFLKCNVDEEELDRQFLECRPENCKKFPYTDQPESLQSLYSVLDAIEVCPAAFEIWERLKEIYGFHKIR